MMKKKLPEETVNIERILNEHIHTKGKDIHSDFMGNKDTYQMHHAHDKDKV